MEERLELTNQKLRQKVSGALASLGLVCFSYTVFLSSSTIWCTRLSITMAHTGRGIQRIQVASLALKTTSHLVAFAFVHAAFGAISRVYLLLSFATMGGVGV